VIIGITIVLELIIVIVKRLLPWLLAILYVRGPLTRGREQRQKEVKRQERELRESRKNYDLPGYNRPLKSEADEAAPVAEETPSPARTASQAWLEKRAREEEQKYWHSWHTCPSERQNQENAEDASEEIMHGYEGPRGPRRGLVKPPQPYDGGVR